MRGLAIAALVLLAAPAVAQAQVTRERAVELGAEAYRYGLPLLEFLRVWGEMTSSQRVNSFDHARRFARPQDRTVVAPNVDTLRPRQLPPVRAFWSLTLYDGESYLVPNPASATRSATAIRRCTAGRTARSSCGSSPSAPPSRA